MGKKSKGFQQLLKQQKKSSQSPEPKLNLRVVESDDLDDIASKTEADYAAQEERIGKIIGMDDEGNLNPVTEETLAKYRSYLAANLGKNCVLTGSEDFPWEEKYVFGYGSKQEHDELRKTRASYMDTFELLKINHINDPLEGLTAQVKRLEDGKEFSLDLTYLEAVDKSSTDYQLIKDYSFWQVNWAY